METDEQLETGNGAATPPGDNLCNDYQQGLTEAWGTLAAMRGDRVLRDSAVMLTDASSPSLFCNIAIVRAPWSDDRWRVEAQRMHSFFAEASGGSFLLFSAWPTPDLTALDFGRVGHPPLMLRLPAPVTVDPIPGLEIRPVADEAGAQAWESALVGGFPLPELQPVRAGCVLPACALAAPGWQHWVGYLDGAAVAAASAYVGAHHVGVEYIATLEPARGRGIGRAMAATATAACPDLPAMLIASDRGRPVYERLGYRPLLRYTVWAGHRRRHTGHQKPTHRA